MFVKNWFENCWQKSQEFAPNNAVNADAFSLAASAPVTAGVSCYCPLSELIEK